MRKALETKLLLKSPAIMAGSVFEKPDSKPKGSIAFGITETRGLPSAHNELCDRLKVFLQENEAGTICNNEKTTALADKLLEYKCRYIKQYSTLFEYFLSIKTGFYYIKVQLNEAYKIDRRSLK